MVAVAKKTEVRLYPRLLVVRMLKASFKVRLWPISNGNAVMTYVGFRSKSTNKSGITQESEDIHRKSSDQAEKLK